jgi:hypothetical protein
MVDAGPVFSAYDNSFVIVVFTVCQEGSSTDLSATKPSALKTIMMGISCLMYGKMATILWPAKRKRCSLQIKELKTAKPEYTEGKK